MHKEVSIVVAALNEQELIAPTVYEIAQNCNAHLTRYELILVDDGSTDRTGAIMEDLARELPYVSVIHHVRKSGLGTVLQTGLKVAQYKYTMLLCGDGGVPGESLPPVFAKVGTADLVIPYMENLKKIKTPLRYLLSRSYTTILNILFWQNLRYYNGLPIYKTQDLKELKIVSRGFAFQAEIVTKLLKSGCSYVEVATKGAEKSNRSAAVNIRGFYEVAKIMLILVWEVLVFKPAKQTEVKYDPTA